MPGIISQPKSRDQPRSPDSGGDCPSDAVDVELPASQPSDAEHSAIHDQLTLPLDSFRRATQRSDPSQSCSSGEDDSGDNGDGSSSSDDDDGSDDARRNNLSDYSSDNAISYVESCSSLSSFTDDDDDDSDGDNNCRKRKRSSFMERRRQSNSDTDVESDSDNESHEENNLNGCEKEIESEQNDTGDESKTPPDKPDNKTSKDNKAESGPKVTSIWDVDYNRPRPPNPKRKLWSDYTYNPEPTRQPRPGSRFTNSFSEKGPGRGFGTEPSWNTNRNNYVQPQPQLGLGLGRGVMHKNTKGNDSRWPGSSNTWQNRRPNNPYCHYQQQQRYFALPRGSYASVVQKGPKERDIDPSGPQQTGSGATRFPHYGQQGDTRGNQPQNHQRQYNKPQQQDHQRQYNKPQQQDRPQVMQEVQKQSYNRGTITAAQILHQQKLQQSMRVEAKRQQDQQKQQHHQQPQNFSNQGEWKPPLGALPLPIGNQLAYVVYPKDNTNIPTIAQEDPAILYVDPPMPQPYLLFPGGGAISFSMAMQGEPPARHITEDALRRVCRSFRRTLLHVHPRLAPRNHGNALSHVSHPQMTRVF